MNRVTSIIAFILLTVMVFGVTAGAVEKTADFKSNRRAKENKDEVDSAIEKAINHLKADKSQFNIQDPDKELKLQRVGISSYGMTLVRFRQYYKELCVIGSCVQLHFDSLGNMMQISGKYFGDLDISTKPELDSISVIENAIKHVKIESDSVSYSAAKLVVFAREKSTSLAWEVRIIGVNLTKYLIVYMSANTGEFLGIDSKRKHYNDIGQGTGVMGDRYFDLKVWYDTTEFHYCLIDNVTMPERSLVGQAYSGLDGMLFISTLQNFPQKSTGINKFLFRFFFGNTQPMHGYRGFD